jgi:hypothetical protein
MELSNLNYQEDLAYDLYYLDDLETAIDVVIESALPVYATFMNDTPEDIFNELSWFDETKYKEKMTDIRIALAEQLNHFTKELKKKLAPKTRYHILMKTCDYDCTQQGSVNRLVQKFKRLFFIDNNNNRKEQSLAGYLYKDLPVGNVGRLLRELTVRQDEYGLEVVSYILGLAMVLIENVISYRHWFNTKGYFGDMRQNIRSKKFKELKESISEECEQAVREFIKENIIKGRLLLYVKRLDSRLLSLASRKKNFDISRANVTIEQIEVIQGPRVELKPVEKKEITNKKYSQIDREEERLYQEYDSIDRNIYDIDYQQIGLMEEMENKGVLIRRNDQSSIDELKLTKKAEPAQIGQITINDIFEYDKNKDLNNGSLITLYNQLESRKEKLADRQYFISRRLEKLRKLRKCKLDTSIVDGHRSYVGLDYFGRDGYNLETRRKRKLVRLRMIRKFRNFKDDYNRNYYKNYNLDETGEMKVKVRMKRNKLKIINLSNRRNLIQIQFNKGKEIVEEKLSRDRLTKLLNHVSSKHEKRRNRSLVKPYLDVMDCIG